MGLDKLADALSILEITALSADDVFDDTAKLGFSTFVFAVFAPNAYDEGVFCH